MLRGVVWFRPAGPWCDEVWSGEEWIFVVWVRYGPERSGFFVVWVRYGLDMCGVLWRCFVVWTWSRRRAGWAGGPEGFDVVLVIAILSICITHSLMQSRWRCNVIWPYMIGLVNVLYVAKLLINMMRVQEYLSVVDYVESYGMEGIY